MSELSLDPRSTALVLIDLQHSNLARTLAPYSGHEVTARCAMLADKLRSAGGTVVYVRVLVNELSPVTADKPLGRPAGSPPLPESAWQIVSEAHMQAGDVLIEKRQYGAFYGTGLDQQLRRRNIRTIALGGIATNIGVESTARAALDRGYALVFAEDGMSGLTEAAHRFACDTIFPILGRVRSSDEIARAIEAGARA